MKKIKLELRLKELEDRVMWLEEYLANPKPVKRGPKTRTYNMWARVRAMLDNGVSKAAVCRMFNIGYKACTFYQDLPESEAKKLPTESAIKKWRKERKQ